jgi:hypothetical protein
MEIINEYRDEAIDFFLLIHKIRTGINRQVTGLTQHRVLLCDKQAYTFRA